MRELEKNSVEILVSPCRLGIMNQLARAEDGLTESEISSRLATNPVSFERHLNKLIEAQVVRAHEDRYALTGYGKRVYTMMQNIARAKETVKVTA